MYAWLFYCLQNLALVEADSDSDSTSDSSDSEAEDTDDIKCQTNIGPVTEKNIKLPHAAKSKHKHCKIEVLDSESSSASKDISPVETKQDR